MTLYTETSGSGPDIVFVHGWALHGAVWRDVVDALRERFRVTTVDLPGHGRSAWDDNRFENIEDLVVSVASIDIERGHWVGWSLGGMATLKLATTTPRRFDSLTLIATTPRFVATRDKHDWSCGVHPAALQVFCDELATDYRGVVNRFLSLQSQGDEAARELIRRLRSEVFEHGGPDPAALAAGLAVLRQTDLRCALSDMDVPCLLIGGSHDALVSPESVSRSAKLLPSARVEIIAQASHAPFLSHHDEFVRLLSGFLSSNQVRQRTLTRVAHV
ncbi:MAG: pimeloyl-ACP methyl ester esterase BioH [Gammaproteobacteria bacterium]